MDNNSHSLTRREFMEKAGKTAALIGISGFAPLIGCSEGVQDSVFDVLIKGGIIYDGTNTVPYIADIGIKQDKIVAIGELPYESLKTIEANGLIVTPGFIDVHTHCDLTFQRTGLKRYLSYLMPSWKGNHNYLYQGVTTVVTGNCGYGYPNTSYWLDIVDSVGFGTNVYHLIPHGMIRQELFGSNQPRELNRTQLDLMKKRVSEEMEKGAIGLSTGLEYAPGFHSTTEELIEVAKIVKSYGGIYATHMRDQSGQIHENGEAGIIQSIREAIEIGRESEIPVEISHLHIKAPYENVQTSQLMELIEESRTEGIDVTVDQHPYDAGSSSLVIHLPNRFKTGDGIKEEFKTNEGRKELKKAIEHVFTYLGPDKIVISSFPEVESYEGKTINEISGIMNKSPSDCFVDMACEDTPPVSIYFNRDMKTVREIMVSDNVITASDGWTVPKDMSVPHPRCYGTFSKKLKQFVFDEKLLSLAGAIRSMTSLPARKFNIKKRGKIKKGYYADMAVINLNTMTDNSTYQKPHQYSDGIEHLLVNGMLSIENGKTTGNRGGRALKRG